MGDVPQLAAIRPKGEGDLHIGILCGPPAVDGVVFKEALYLFSMDAKLRRNLIIGRTISYRHTATNKTQEINSALGAVG